ncbi:MAG: SBBP repeat-containing protein, partial [Bacteroidota bacterium]|nr:SBBP repeat-containing protein [Bacteroidota bacterium]
MKDFNVFLLLLVSIMICFGKQADAQSQVYDQDLKHEQSKNELRHSRQQLIFGDQKHDELLRMMPNNIRRKYERTDISTDRFNNEERTKQPLKDSRWWEEYFGASKLLDRRNLRRYSPQNRILPSRSIPDNDHHTNLFINETHCDSVYKEWSTDYASGLAPSHGIAFAMAIDNSGNVYVTGVSEGAGTYTDFATVKYTTDGAQEWVTRFNREGNPYDEPIAIAIDVYGNIYITGISWSSDSDYDYVTIKYNNDGIQQWVAIYNGQGNTWDIATALAVDVNGNVYVTGYSKDKYTTAKYDSSGIEQWVSHYKGPTNYNTAASIGVDKNGYIYVTGTSGGLGSSLDYATVKYNSAGIEQWVRRYNGPGNNWDAANSLALDPSGNIYVTGESFDNFTNQDYTTIKYNSNGDEQWIKRYNGNGNSLDIAEAMTIDTSGNVYITGKRFSSGVSYLTIMYDSTGIEQWASEYSEKSANYAINITVDYCGNVYVTGSSFDAIEEITTNVASEMIKLYKKTE